MKVELIKPSELVGELLAKWKQIQKQDVGYDSPFFSPMFTQIVSRHRSDVEIGVIRQDNRVVGFFPFQRGKRNHGLPVGWKLNDYQGFILEDGIDMNPIELIRKCKLASWRFDHLLASKAIIQSNVFDSCESPFIDIVNGFDQYLADKRREGSRRFQSFARKARKLSRDVGPLRIDFKCFDESMLDRLMKWKSEHLDSLGMNNAFKLNWATNTTRDIFQEREHEFQGNLSALYAGDHLVAIHFGPRNGQVLHWWLTTYNREFERFSPGVVFLFELLRACEENGVAKIDLGKGQEPYKLSFQNGSTMLCEGAYTSSSWHYARFRSRNFIRGLVRDTPVQQLVNSFKVRFSKGDQSGEVPVND